MKRLLALVLFVAVTQTLQAATACPHPVLDGVFSGTEWSLATHYSVTINVPGGGSVPGDLYAFNDDRDIYFCLRYARGEVNDRTISVFFDFDSNGNGLWDGVDDWIQMIRYLDYAGTTPRLIDGYYPSSWDIDAGGANDGAVAVGFSGAWTTIEGKHPLNSGQPYDIAAPVDSIVRYRMTVRIFHTADLSSGADTVFPPSGWLTHWVQSSMDLCHSTQ